MDAPEAERRLSQHQTVSLMKLTEREISLHTRRRKRTRVREEVIPASELLSFLAERGSKQPRLEEKTESSVKEEPFPYFAWSSKSIIGISLLARETLENGRKQLASASDVDLKRSSRLACNSEKCVKSQPIQHAGSSDENPRQNGNIGHAELSSAETNDVSSPHASTSFDDSREQHGRPPDDDDDDVVIISCIKMPKRSAVRDASEGLPVASESETRSKCPNMRHLELRKPRQVCYFESDSEADSEASTVSCDPDQEEMVRGMTDERLSKSIPENPNKFKKSVLAAHLKALHEEFDCAFENLGKEYDNIIHVLQSIHHNDIEELEKAYQNKRDYYEKQRCVSKEMLSRKFLEKMKTLKSPQEKAVLEKLQKNQMEREDKVYDDILDMMEKSHEKQCDVLNDCICEKKEANEKLFRAKRKKLEKVYREKKKALQEASKGSTGSRKSHLDVRDLATAPYVTSRADSAPGDVDVTIRGAEELHGTRNTSAILVEGHEGRESRKDSVPTSSEEGQGRPIAGNEGGGDGLEPMSSVAANTIVTGEGEEKEHEEESSVRPSIVEPLADLGRDERRKETADASLEAGSHDCLLEAAEEQSEQSELVINEELEKSMHEAESSDVLQTVPETTLASPTSAISSVAPDCSHELMELENAAAASGEANLPRENVSLPSNVSSNKVIEGNPAVTLQDVPAANACAEKSRLLPETSRVNNAATGPAAGSEGEMLTVAYQSEPLHFAEVARFVLFERMYIGEMRDFLGNQPGDSSYMAKNGIMDYRRNAFFDCVKLLWKYFHNCLATGISEAAIVSRIMEWLTAKLNHVDIQRHHVSILVKELVRTSENNLTVTTVTSPYLNLEPAGSGSKSGNASQHLNESQTRNARGELQNPHESMTQGNQVNSRHPSLRVKPLEQLLQYPQAASSHPPELASDPNMDMYRHFAYVQRHLQESTRRVQGGVPLPRIQVGRNQVQLVSNTAQGALLANQGLRHNNGTYQQVPAHNRVQVSTSDAPVQVTMHMSQPVNAQQIYMSVRSRPTQIQQANSTRPQLQANSARPQLQANSARPQLQTFQPFPLVSSLIRNSTPQRVHHTKYRNKTQDAFNQRILQLQQRHQQQQQQRHQQQQQQRQQQQQQSGQMHQPLMLPDINVTARLQQALASQRLQQMQGMSSYANGASNTPMWMPAQVPQQVGQPREQVAPPSYTEAMRSYPTTSTTTEHLLAADLGSAVSTSTTLSSGVDVTKVNTTAPLCNWCRSPGLQCCSACNISYCCRLTCKGKYWADHHRHGCKGLGKK